MGRKAWKLSAVALLCTLCVPALAPAVTGKYKGTVAGDEDATIRFKMVRSHGKRKVSEKAGWKALDATCDGEVAPIKTKFYVTAKVRKTGAFRLDGSDSEQSEVYMEGTIAAGGTASGTLRLKTEVLFDDGVRNCDSGIRTWNAELE